VSSVWLEHVPYVLAFLAISGMAFGQTASLRGQVVDESGAVVPKATVTIAGRSGVVKTTAAAGDGSYSLTGLAPGDYTVQATLLDQQNERRDVIVLARAADKSIH